MEHDFFLLFLGSLCDQYLMSTVIADAYREPQIKTASVFESHSVRVLTVNSLLNYSW